MAEPHPFRRAAEAKDLELMRDALAEDVVLHSPVTFHGFEGRDAVLFVLSNVIAVFENFAYLEEVTEGDRVILRFRADVGDRELEGIDYLELDADGRVTELTVFIRPLSALTVFAERMAARIAASPPPAAA